MMRRLFNLLNRTSAPEPEETFEFFLLDDTYFTETNPTQDDATRPSYRVGKNHPVDIHKAIDLSG